MTPGSGRNNNIKTDSDVKQQWHHQFLGDDDLSLASNEPGGWDYTHDASITFSVQVVPPELLVLEKEVFNTLSIKTEDFKGYRPDRMLRSNIQQHWLQWSRTDIKPIFKLIKC